MIRTLFAVALAASAASAQPTGPGAHPPAPNPQPAGAPLRVGATAVPHAVLLRAVAPELEAQGVKLDIRVYEDYARPNIDVARGALDANFFQTEPYLWRWRGAHMQPLVVAGRVHVEPMGLYSRKLKASDPLSGIRTGAVVAVPEDPANLGRALFLLQKAGLILVDERRGLDAVLNDITDNPHKLKFRLVPAQRIADQLSSADLVALNGNFALEAGLKPEQELYREGSDSPFPNVVVCREEMVTDPRITALVAALRGPTAKKLLLEKFPGFALPAQ
jgi:D-methionine transport system substrate-binding protein